MSLSTSTGTVSGTPTSVAAQTNYTVTAENATGSTSATLQIEVDPSPSPAAPSDLVYPETTITVIVGQAITPDIPTVTGIVTSYSVSPALPAGLILISTGTITGTPTAVTAQANYTVTAENATGSTTATLQIAVGPVPAPSNLVYPQTGIAAIVGQAITPDTPTVTGTVTSYSVSPALPAGLGLGPTGTISGTPTSVAALANYTVTAENAVGSTSTTLQIVVGPANPAAPSNLVYPQMSITATAGTAIQTDTPTVSGTVTSYSVLGTVSPALPAGLSLDYSTGAISGTPTTATAQSNYTVTASNSYGSTSATLSITVTQASTLLDLSGYEGVISMTASQDILVVSTASGTTLFYNLNGATGPTLTSTANLEEIQMSLSSDATILGALNSTGDSRSTPSRPWTFYIAIVAR